MHCWDTQPAYTLQVVRFARSIGVSMDTIEAKKNLKRYEAEIDKYQNLSRGLMSREEMLVIDKKIAQLKLWAKNLRNELNA